MHPLDLIKTRMQLQGVKAEVLSSEGINRVYYDGLFDCVQKMFRHEGILSFYKGILPPIMAETPKRAVKFFTFEQYKNFFSLGSTTVTPFIYSLAGAAAGVTEAIVINPFEVVKVSLQSDRNKLNLSPSTYSVTRQIIKTGGLGLNGLNKGLTATVFRNGVFNMIYFGFYHSVKDKIPKIHDATGEFFKKLLIGFSAGTLASCMNIPFDVAKSRMQGPQPKIGEVKYKSLFPTMHTIYKEEGWRALYKGLLPKVMRLGPGGAVMLVVYDLMSEFIQKKFPD
ncbi:UNVERIFIED_CONTAM: hypothetical protein PYX00_009264 [Menopon gallinae]